ncbi:MAG: hypothetical protein HHJ14_07940 [Cellulomonas sp.]|uniref:hypothetical protein n=1 Tax=Cellulomonas sp. TaxID=40001 RepID=UPI001835D7BE|nr:hypothetical protein [Cellulomonas sp.]NMM17060.1 hypothetical protein [Cellulomonas sp.]NMM29787.1 hypothetical protein [Cellulomonas sp.]
MTPSTRISRRKTHGIAALVGAALISGGMVIAAPMAGASDVGTSPSPTSATSTVGPTTPAIHRAHRHHVRGTAPTAPEVANVTATVLATYPGATVRHIVLDAHGVYRARIVTSDGQRVTVKVSKTFTVISSHVSSHHKTAAKPHKA